MLSALGLACVLAQAPTSSPEPAVGPAPVPTPTIEPMPPAHPARINWALDGAITGGAAITFGILELWVTPQMEPPTVQTPGVPDEIGPVDAVAVGHFIPEAATASDALLIASVATPIVLHGVEAGVRGDRVGLRYGTDLMLLGEIMAVDLLLTEIFKQAVRRPRPFVYANPDGRPNGAGNELEEAQREPDALKSFPSGHASLAWAAAVGGSTLLTMKWRHGTRRQKVGIGLTWGLTTFVALGTGTLRVVAGKHYPSDVLAGMALGSSVGLIVPLAHKRRPNLSVTPVALGRTRLLSVSGRF